MTLRELINSVDSEQYSESALYQKLREAKPEYGSNRRIQVNLEQSVLPVIPMGKLIQPEDIAETILFLASEQARMLTGQVIKVSGGHAL